MAGATGKAAAQVNAIPDVRTRKAWTAAFLFWTRTRESRAPIPGGAQPETTMTKRIGTTSLKDFARRDFLLSSVLTAALFTAALLLFPDSKTEGKRPEVTAQVSSR